MRKLYAYTHTHWDREWYQPFESFRIQLVHLVRRVLDGLEARQLPRFYLDGQSIIIDDVLEVDRSLEPRIRKSMQDGTLSAGPWYVLADQALVSGESLIRNLSIGLNSLKNYGKPALIGYCPDTFGHTADLPRILKGFGISSAVVWRGVPSLDMGPIFWWYSPDGSRVLAYHLTNGYYQTAFHEAGSAIDKLVASLPQWVSNQALTNGSASSYCELVDGALLPIGADHTEPPRRLNELIDQVNEKLRGDKQDIEVVATTLPEFLAKVQSRVSEPMTLVQKVVGELRSNISAPKYGRSYLLPGVISTRLYLKRANRLAEYKLARLVEPLATILQSLGLGVYPVSELEYAWKLLLKNHPHDSICGCSADSVHREMMVRTERLNQALDSLLDWASVAIAGQVAGSLQSAHDPEFGCNRLAIFNTSGHEVEAPVFMRWYADSCGGKDASHSDHIQITARYKADHLFSSWGVVPYYKSVEVLEGWVWAGRVPALGGRSIAWPDALDVIEVTEAEEIAQTSSHNPSVDESGSKSAPADSIVADSVIVAPALKAALNRAPAPSASQAVKVRNNRISNGNIEVAVRSDGQLVATHFIEGDLPAVYELKHQIQDVGDGGDSYNFDPVPEDSPVRARFISVKPAQRGPLRGSLILTYEIDIPASLESVAPLRLKNDPDADKITVLKRSSRIKHRITTEISLRKGVALVFFETRWTNESKDHRLEVSFETGKRVTQTHAENHFSIIKRRHNQRGLVAEKLPVPLAHEAPIDRFVCQRFFIANNQAFFNMGMPEYGVDDSKVSLTLLRAVSWLSKPRLWNRGGGAGPNVEVTEANCIGENVCSYGWAPLAVSSRKTRAFCDGEPDVMYARAYELAELYEGPLWAAPTRSAFWKLPPFSLLSVENHAIRVVSVSVSGDRSDSLVLRLLNVTGSAQHCRLSLDAEHLTGEMAITHLSGELLQRLEANLEANKDSGRFITQLSFREFQLLTVSCKLLRSAANGHPPATTAPTSLEQAAQTSPAGSAIAKKKVGRVKSAARKGGSS